MATAKKKPAARARQVPASDWVQPTSIALVMAASVLAIVTFLTSANDVYSQPKAAALIFGALLLVGTLLWSFASTGTAPVTTSRVALLLGAAMVVMALATVLGDLPMRSLFGEYGRAAGLLTYLAGAVLFVVLLTFATPARLRAVAWALAGAAGLVVFYGTLQWAGAEPFAVPVEKTVVSTFGQINFVGGFSGPALALLLWLALDRAHPPWLRVVGAVALPFTLLVAVKSLSFQSYGSIAAGAGVLLVAWGLDRFGGRIVLAAAVVVVVVGAGVGLALHDKVEHQVRDGLDERVLMWQAGRDMVLDRPVLGFGPAGYADEFSTYRPKPHIRYGIYASVDAPHDVPLSMFVIGGVPLGLLYLAFVGTVGVLLVRGLRRLRGDARLLLGVFGGVWAAYQVQSLVSIDVPSFIVLHLVSAAAIVSLATEPAVRTFTVGSLVGRHHRGRAEVTSAGRAIQVGTGLVVVVLAFLLVFRPLSADVAFAHGRQDRANQDLAGAIDEYDTATGHAGWVGAYWPELAGTLAESGDQDRALLAGEKAADLNPSAASYALATAQLAARMDRRDVADRYFDMAVRHARFIADTYRARAEYHVTIGKDADAVPDLRKVVELLPTNVPDWLLLGSALDRLGRTSEADAVWHSVLEIEPKNPSANQNLGRPIPPQD